MPVWNAAPYLREAVDSILGQTFQAFEFIIVNDGSQDASGDILASYRDPRIRLVSLPQNVGVAHALNRGLEEVKSPYIARMDADDWAYPERLALQYECMESNPQLMICGTWAESFEAVPYAQGYYGQTHEEICLHLLFRKALFCHPSVMMRKEVLEFSQGYDPIYSHSEDMALWYDSYHLGQMANLPQILLKYRRHPAQISQKEQVLSQQWAHQIFQNWIDGLMPELALAVRRLHIELVHKRFPHTLEGLPPVAAWAQDLYRWNQENKFIPDALLLPELAKHWFYACNSVQPLNRKVWQMYRNFPFRRHFPIGYAHTWEFFWNCMRNRNSTYL